MNFQCNDCDTELNDQSSFIVTPSTTENNIRIGDTLFLKTSLSSQIPLQFSGSIHDNSDQLINYRLEIFEGINSNTDAKEARDDFEYINKVGMVSMPTARTWEILIENTCDENLCELEFGMIPQKKGRYGLLLKAGRFGLDNECDFLSLFPPEIESDGNNNFEIFNEINLSNIRVDNVFFDSPESELLLYFFKVIE